MAIAHISHAVSNKYSRCRTTLLSGPGNVGHADADGEADYRSKEPNHSVSSYGCGSPMGPAASPDHGTASDDRDAAEDKEDETDVSYLAGEISCQENEDENNAAEWELKKYRVKRRPPVRTAVSKSTSRLDFLTKLTQKWTR